MDIIPEIILYDILSFTNISLLLQYITVSKLFNRTILNILHNLKKYNCEKITKNTLRKILKETPQLETLKISRCYLLDVLFFTKISPCLTNLVDITILNNYYIYDKSILQITLNMPLLTSINLTKCRKITNKSLKYIAENCENISRINVSYCNQISNKGIIDITNTRAIIHLDLGYCIELTSLGIVFSDISNLQFIDMTCCYKIMDNAINYILTTAPHLEELNIGHCDRISDNAFFNTTPIKLKSICLRNITNITLNSFPRVQTLETLNILGCHHICEQTLCYLLKTNINLKVFNCKYCNNITKKVIDTILDYNHLLEDLDIGYCYRITSINLDKILDKLKNIKRISLYGSTNCNFYVNKYNIRIPNSLEYIDLSYCSNLTNTYLCDLLEKCYNLKYVIVNGYTNITPNVVNAIISSLSNTLEKISFTNNSNLDVDNINKILQNCNKLNTISIGLSIPQNKLLRLKYSYPHISIY